MRVAPKHTSDGDIRTVPSTDWQAIWIECEVLDPPSAKGRTVYFYADREDVLALLHLTKGSAIRARSNPMTAGV